MPDEGEDGNGVDRSGDEPVDDGTVQPEERERPGDAADLPDGSRPGRRTPERADVGAGPEPGGVALRADAHLYDEDEDEEFDDDEDEGLALVGSVRDPRVTARLRSPVVIEGEDEEPRSALLLAAGAVALVLVGVLLGVGLVVGGIISLDGAEDGAAPAPTTAAATTAAPGPAPTTTSTTDGVDADQAATSDGAGSDDGEAGALVTTPTVMTAAPPVGTSTPDNPRGALAYMVLEDGVLHFRGLYPSRELLDGLVADAVTANGPGGVVDEGEIDPAASFDDESFPLYLEDLILFGSKSAELSDEFKDVLSDTVRYLVEDPDATITVVARTDYLGDADENMELSRQRAQAVVDFWISEGVDPERLAIDPRGEQEADQNPTTAEEAALDRRVELVISGLG